jgi:hypothetical protein
VLLGEIQSSHRMGFNDCPRLDQDPTLRRGDFLPKNRDLGSDDPSARRQRVQSRHHPITGQCSRKKVPAVVALNG